MLETRGQIRAASVRDGGQRRSVRGERAGSTWCASDGVQERRLVAREGEAESILHMRCGELHCALVAADRSALKIRSTWMRESKNGGGFVKGFARGIIHRVSNERDGAVLLPAQEGRVTAARNQSDGWELHGFGIDRRRDKMRHHMINAHERLPCGPRERLGSTHSDEQRSDQSGLRGDGNAIHLGERHARPAQRRAHHGQPSLSVRATGNLGHDAAVAEMQMFLCRDNGRQLTNQARTFAALHDARSGFVATCLDSKDQHGAQA